MDRAAGAMFAAQAAVAASDGQAYAASAQAAVKLRQPMDSRAAIDQAIGILIERHGWGPGAAFDSHLRNHILPLLGHRPMGAITRSEIQGWVKSLSEVLVPCLETLSR